MLIDPLFARWIVAGDGPSPAGVTGADQAARFAAYERIVHRRTNSLLGAGGRLGLPWPQALGTPPWGVKRELEFGAARRGTRYDVEVLRGESSAALGARFDRLLRLVCDGEPAILYVGNARLPRHITLILPDRGDGNLEVYEPAAGIVRELTRAEFTARRLALGGWQLPWFAVQPIGARRERRPAFSVEATPA